MVRDWLRRWSRRALSISLLSASFVAMAVLLPILLPLCLIIDALRPRWSATRALLFFVLYLGLEVCGVVASFAIWLLRKLEDDPGDTRYLRRNFRLQCWWAHGFFVLGSRIFGIRLHEEQPPELGARPVILFIRHTSMADTILAASLVSRNHDVGLRYVLKHGLQWDPCLDIVGNRLTNCFVRRGSGESASEIRRVASLMHGLLPGEGVLIYPEGTRFTQAKRQRALDRASSDAEALLRLERYKNVLPPRRGGAMALLENNAGADAMFCAHVGLEGATSFGELAGGGLVHRSLHVSFWTVPFEAIPRTSQGRRVWLDDQWQRVDEFVSKVR